MSSKKNLAVTFGAVALTAVLTIGGTLAYLSSVTEVTSNTFSSDEGIKTEIKEEFSKDEASKYAPGQVITKKPTMVNISGSEDESKGEPIYVASSLEFQGNEGTNIPYSEFKKYAQIKRTTTDTLPEENSYGVNPDWTLIAKAKDGKELYMYKSELGKGETTTAIFDETKVNAGITTVLKTEYKTTTVYTKNEQTGELTEVSTTTDKLDTKKLYFDKDGNIIDIFKLPNFYINVKGYAVQASNTEFETAKKELIDLANANLSTADKYEAITIA